MTDDRPAELLAPDGRPARRALEERLCPRCGSDRRENTAGFGYPVICCGSCGYYFQGATE
jgi:uncharacterized protein (DUF983 family)